MPYLNNFYAKQLSLIMLACPLFTGKQLFCSSALLIICFINTMSNQSLFRHLALPIFPPQQIIIYLTSVSKVLHVIRIKILTLGTLP